MISTNSFALSIILFNLALVLVFLLRRKRYFIARYGIQVLILIVALGIIRLFSPVDWQLAHIIRSDRILPAIQTILRYSIPRIGLSVGGTLLAVWAAGIVVYAIRDITMLIRFWILRNGYILCDAPHISEVAKSLNVRNPLVVTRCVTTPHVAGHLKPVIYVPPLELSDEDWKYVLRHEMQHIAAHDQQIKLLFLLLRTVFWWNPVSHRFIKELDAILELRCDEQVCAKLSEDEQISYFGAMLKVMRQIKPDNKRAVSAVTGLVGGQSENRYNIKQRYEVYANSNKRRSKAVRSGLCILICLVFLASYFVIVQPIYLPPEEDMAEIEGAIAEETFITYSDNKYFLWSGNEQIMEIPEEEIDNFPYNTMHIYEGKN